MPGRRQRRTRPTSGESSGELPLTATGYLLWELGPLHTQFWWGMGTQGLRRVQVSASSQALQKLCQ